MATLRGEPVDRPAVNFYEIGGFQVDPEDPDPFNIYNSPDWKPLLQLAEERSDLIRMRNPVRARSHDSWQMSSSADSDEFFETQSFLENGCRMSRTTVTIGGRTLTSLTKREPGIDTVWTVEHLLKDLDDLKAYLQIPDTAFLEQFDVTPLIEEEKELGDAGVIMVDTEDPLAAAATLFDLETYTILAWSEQRWFHRLLEKCATYLHARTRKLARDFPGRLWRVCGPEYAVEPFLPTSLFREYVVRYTGPMIRMIQEHGGYARLHVHGRLKNVLDDIASMGVDAIDPIEPPPQGDVELEYVRQKYGKDIALFGNLEIADLENQPPERFEAIARKSLEDGTKGEGRGFVLMPSASPYGRTISANTLKNYEMLVNLVEAF